MLIIAVVLLEGKSWEFFLIKQGVAMGCIPSPTSFLTYINGSLCEIEK